jgi:hypothetical protein
MKLLQSRVKQTIIKEWMSPGENFIGRYFV